MALAKEHGKELTLEQAQALLDRVKRTSPDGELSDEDLEAIVGGSSAAVEFYDSLFDWCC